MLRAHIALNAPCFARRGKTIPLVILALLLASAAAVMIVPSTRQQVMTLVTGKEEVVGSGFISAKAEKAPFRIMITENGTIDSLRNVTLSNRVEGSTTIISLIPEGSKVNAPVVAEFEGVAQFVDSASESSKSVKVVAEDGTEKVYEVVFGEFTKMLVKDRQKVRKGDKRSMTRRDLDAFVGFMGGMGSCCVSTVGKAQAARCRVGVSAPPERAPKSARIPRTKALADAALSPLVIFIGVIYIAILCTQVWGVF